MNSDIDQLPPALLFVMNSGAKFSISEIFLLEADSLLKAQAIQLNANAKLGGVSSGIGFLGSPQWVLAGALALGFLEGLASKAAAEKGVAELMESEKLFLQARSEGRYVPVEKISGISIPNPGSWKCLFTERQEIVIENSRYKTTTTKEVNHSYTFGNQLFVQAKTIEGSEVFLAWEKVESYSLSESLKNLESLKRKDSSSLDEENAKRLYGIVRDGEKYIYGEFKYDRLVDAVSYAKKSKGI